MNCGMRAVAGYLDNVRIAAGKRLRALQSAMEDEGLDLIMLFEGDLIAYKIALTSHFNIVLVANDDIYVVSDPTLYHEAVGGDTLERNTGRKPYSGRASWRDNRHTGRT